MGFNYNTAISRLTQAIQIETQHDTRDESSGHR